MYLFHTNKGFILVNTTPKNGIFCQRFYHSLLPKSLSVYSGRLLDYSATIDQNGTIYIATLPDATHLNYYTYEGNRFVPHTLISNEQSNFELSSPILYTMNQMPYLIYVSHQLLSPNYDFVSENLSRSHLTSLLTLTSQPKLIKSYVTPNEIFIFFVVQDTQYHLNALVITNEGIRHVAYLTSSDPIVDYNVCIEETIVHLVFETEIHGKYQLAYLNTVNQKITTLITTQHPSEPVVFSYYNLIWINAMINHKLQIFLSINNGDSFSIPTPCTLQNNLSRCQFMTYTVSPFIGQELYVSMTPRPKLCTLAMIDMPHFHPDSKVPTELELLLEALSFKLDQLEETVRTVTKPSQTPSQPSTPSPTTPSTAPLTRPYTSYATQSTPQSTYRPNATSPQSNYIPNAAPPSTSYTPNTSPSQAPYTPNTSPSQAPYTPNTSPPPAPIPQSQPLAPNSQPFTSEPQQTQPFIASPERPYTTSPNQEEETAIESATEAFMEEFNGWDLPPRV